MVVGVTSESDSDAENAMKNPKPIPVIPISIHIYVYSLILLAFLVPQAHLCFTKILKLSSVHVLFVHVVHFPESLFVYRLLYHLNGQVLFTRFLHYIKFCIVISFSFGLWK